MRNVSRDLVFLVATGLVAAGTSRAEPRPKAPAPGVLLVAKPSIEGGPFWHSVVLLLSHGEQGTLGLIINRATEIPLSEAMPELDSEQASSHSLHFGGPVKLDGLLFLFRSDHPPKEVAKVMDDVYFSGDRKVLEKLLKDKAPPERLALYVGHSGWSPGQLDAEIARGDWDLAAADIFTLFQRAPDDIWRELTKGATTVLAAQRID